ncbi:hypothetical protein DVS28_b0203 (plasmid) [Euzebya pacifica]|uniref:Uncharacterized protein n=1 Tax=Euzebya pacifica TaxID=1608957 RepID=A0A346Y676_9ACTN|nr:hypothetical protein DVS28_b0203 [Euzebya pacifica]
MGGQAAAGVRATGGGDAGGSHVAGPAQVVTGEHLGCDGETQALMDGPRP